ncbi:MAG TPA: helix-turn-helix domain-containing protein [Steroidobacteraceae bacterium]|nr:helix-turn-helix domain-containing protein [Steroidobacteraceae bacterium]
MQPKPVRAMPGAKAGDRIRETAKQLFYRDGIRAVGVDAIVRHARATKPSLYRSFRSKDELAAAYLRDWDSAFWQRFESAVAAHPDDPRAQLRLFLERLTQRMRSPGYRGCALTNAAVEYPQAGHPARRAAVANKHRLRRRLALMTAAMGARQPRLLADGLALLLEGAYASSQLFRRNGPARAVARVADQLIEASLGRRRLTRAKH